jgi:hypothetical protein
MPDRPAAPAHAALVPGGRTGHNVLGHDAWATIGVEPIGDWRSAPAQAFPALVAAMAG